MFALCWLATAIATAQPAVDRLGDPLPENAIARLGSNRLRGNRIILTPDGKKIVREAGRSDLQISDLVTGKPLVKILASDIPERDKIVGSTIGFTPDGKRMAAVCWKGRCGIWDTETGKLIRWVECSFYSMVRARFSPNGKFLAVGNNVPGANGQFSHSTFVYDVDSGKKLFEAPGEGGHFTADNASLVTYPLYESHRGTIARVRVPSGEIVHQRIAPRLSGEGQDDRAAVGKWFFHAVENGTVECIDLDTLEKKSAWKPDGNQGTDRWRLAIHPNHPVQIGDQYSSGIVAAFDSATGKELWRKSRPAETWRVIRSDDGDTLYIALDNRQWGIWEAKTGREIRKVKFADNGQSMPQVISADGRYAVSQSNSIFGSSAVVWDLKSGKALRNVPGHTSTIEACGLSHDGKLAWTVSDDQSLRTWDAATGTPKSEIVLDKPKYAAIAPDGNTLISANRSGKLWRADATTEQTTASRQVFAKSLFGLAMSRDGKVLVVAGRDNDTAPGSIKFLDPTTLAETKLIEFDGRVGELLALSADGRRVAVSQLGRTVTVWDVPSSTKLRTYRGEGIRNSSWVKPPQETPYQLGAIALNANGTHIAFSDQEAGIAFAAMDTEVEPHHVKIEAFYQSPAARYELSDALAWSPDGSTIAYSGPEAVRSIFLVDVKAKTSKATFTADNPQTRCVAWSPDGSTLLTGGADGTAIVWKSR